MPSEVFGLFILLCFHRGTRREILEVVRAFTVHACMVRAFLEKKLELEPLSPTVAAVLNR